MNVELRKASSREVRLNNSVPGIVYGKGIESIPVQVDLNDFVKSYHQYGKNLTFNVTIEKEKHIVYIKDVQYSLANGSLIHFDLQKVGSKDKIISDISIILEGKDEVSKGGIVLVQYLNELSVEYIVGSGISNVHLDVSKMEENDTLRVSDIELPEEITLLSDLEDIVASLTAAQIFEEPVDEEADEDSDEVIHE